MNQAIALAAAIKIIRNTQGQQPTAIFNMLYHAERSLDSQLAAELRK